MPEGSTMNESPLGFRPTKFPPSAAAAASAVRSDLRALVEDGPSVDDADPEVDNLLSRPPPVQVSEAGSSEWAEVDDFSAFAHLADFIYPLSVTCPRLAHAPAREGSTAHGPRWRQGRPLAPTRARRVGARATCSATPPPRRIYGSNEKQPCSTAARLCCP